MRSKNDAYRNLDSLNTERESVPWYWKLIAIAASWMILGGYLIIPALYDSDPKLRFSKGVLGIFVVALMTAGYSFTALLCFACRNEMFQAESIFLPSLASSALGLLTVLYNFLSSTRFVWNTAAIVSTVLAATSSILYGILLVWAHRRIVKIRATSTSQTNQMWSDSTFYSNFIQNMYPSVRTPAEGPLLTEDDLVNQQMAMLLMKSDPGPSPEASQSTFHIDLPEDREERERMQNSSELLATPSLSHQYSSRTRSATVNSQDRSAWERPGESLRGRSDIRPSRSQNTGGHSRAVSREERRREIELGRYPSSISQSS
ncbi:hypothetical protein K432DRAFT_287631 [Lepidopterella palustris CBS 459.81]|uniref:Uncharacterized protein n=1 Tax=Lepidopterella palustris CBS 459.81 TaxID=1314670 RepID=A0A8E2EJB3_9PEZI|nr:hypothetical protein K432DRAFT_287631 [Lepidopterella palustris CBS 459.81]